jgi:hypothetical protein
MRAAVVFGRFAVLYFMHFPVHSLDTAVEGWAAEKLAR